jgi:hypothetical protein
VCRLVSDSCSTYLFLQTIRKQLKTLRPEDKQQAKLSEACSGAFFVSIQKIQAANSFDY